MEQLVDGELYSSLICALEHDMIVCERCKKCRGENFAEIRMNLVRDLAKATGHEVPWRETEDELQ